jgi:hypothetical protein
VYYCLADQGAQVEWKNKGRQEGGELWKSISNHHVATQWKGMRYKNQGKKCEFKSYLCNVVTAYELWAKYVRSPCDLYMIRSLCERLLLLFLKLPGRALEHKPEHPFKPKSLIGAPHRWMFHLQGVMQGPRPSPSCDSAIINTKLPVCLYQTDKRRSGYKNTWKGFVEGVYRTSTSLSFVKKPARFFLLRMLCVL